MNKVRNILYEYGLFHLIWIVISFLFTKIFYRNCTLLRLPIFIRGKRKISFGKNLITGYLVRIDAFGDKSTIQIGDNVEINDFVHIAAIDTIHIGDNTLIASKVFISDHNHGTFDITGDEFGPTTFPSLRPLTSKPIIIGKNVWIGENVCILPGVLIGDGVVIGAGSIVTKNIPSYTLIVGNPAKVIKKYNFNSKSWDKV